MLRDRRATKRFLVVLVASAAVLVALGAVVAALAGKDVWPTMMWALIIGGGVLVVVNVVGSGSDRALADPRTGFALGLSARDATTSGSSLVTGLILVGLGVGGLLA